MDGDRRERQAASANVAKGTTSLQIDRAPRSTSDAAVVAYMDADLRALLPLVAPLMSGHSELAIGSRLAHGARVVRGPRRELISRTYNLLLRMVFHTRFRDAQCGFKAVRTDVARQLLPEVVDQAWFFDTELLLIAEHNGLRISEIPVDWIDDPDSRVKVIRTSIDDLKGMARVAMRFWRDKARASVTTTGDSISTNGSRPVGASWTGTETVGGRH